VRPDRTTWSRAVFVDTSAFGALSAVREQDHQTAISIRARLTRQQLPLVTTNFVLAETHALLLGKVGPYLALRVLPEIDRSDITIVRVSEADEQRACAILIQYDDKDFSLTDATSFAVMTRLGSTLAFTFDRHFAQFGFQAIGPSE
jgi:predicted nucleic acid-binding protein